MSSKLEAAITSSIFVIVITALSVASSVSCFYHGQLVSSRENRVTAEFPKISSWRKDILDFPHEFELFFSDRLAYRLPIIEFRNQLVYNLFQTSSTPKVVIGKQNWLFYNYDGAGEAQLNRTKFTDYELESWARELEAKSEFLNRHNIKFLLVIAPEKGSIYPELMPNNWQHSNGTSRLEQLQEYLRTHTHVDFVDARKILLDAKGCGNIVYLPRDAHWNPFGAFLVSQEIFKHLSLSFPLVQPLKSNEYHLGSAKLPADLAKMLGIGNNLHDDCSVVVPTEAHAQTVSPAKSNIPNLSQIGASFELKSNNDKLPKALVLRDSFCGFLIPFLSEHFSSTQFHWTNTFLPQVILEQHPDVVVNELAERFLYLGDNNHVPRFLPASQDQSTLCNFGDEVVLQNLRACRTPDGLLVQLKWRAKKSVRLDYNVALRTTSSTHEVVGGADYAPDFLQRRVSKDTSWIGTMLVSNKQLRKASRLEISLYRKGQNSMVCDARNSVQASCYDASIDQILQSSMCRVTKHAL